MENKGKGPARLEAGRAGCEPLVSSQQSNVLDLATTNPESGSTPRLKRNQMETVQDELNKMNEGYSPRSIKRKRYTPAELENLKNKLVEIAEEWGPLNTRGYFYQAEASGLVEKTEAECNRVERMLKELRRNGRIDWDLVSEEGRWCRQPTTFESVVEVLKVAAMTFRLDPWKDQPVRVQIWEEKEGLAPAFEEITDEYCVPLYPGSGFTSWTLSHKGAVQAQEWLEGGQQVVVLLFGDYDPSGKSIMQTIINHYEKINKVMGVKWVHCGLNEEHIARWHLPTRPTKKSDSRAAKFGDERSVELDAVSPDKLKIWVENEIRKYIDFDPWQKTMDREAEQRRKLNEFVKKL